MPSLEVVPITFSVLADVLTPQSKSASVTVNANKHVKYLGQRSFSPQHGGPVVLRPVRATSCYDKYEDMNHTI